MNRLLQGLRNRLNRMLSTDVFQYAELRGMFVTLLIDQMFIKIIVLLSSALVSGAGEAAMAAVSTVGTLNALVSLGFSALAVGGGIVIARAKGRGDVNMIRATICGTTTICFSVATALSVFLYAFAPFLVDLFYSSVEPLVRDYSIHYMRLMCISFVPFSIFNAIFNAFRSLGDMRSSLLLTVVINGLHLLLSLLFINVLDMGVTGSGLSYIVVRVIGMITALFWLLKAHNTYAIHPADFFHVTRGIARDILRLGAPIAMESALLQGGMLLVGIYISKLTTTDIAAHGVTNSLINFAITPGESLAALSSTISGQCVGARRHDLAKQYCRAFIQLGRLVMLFTVLVLLPFTPALMALFKATEQARPIIYRAYFIAVAFLPVLWADSNITPSTLRAAGDVTFTSIISATALIVCRCGIGYVLTIPCGLGIAGVWVSLIVEWLSRAVVFRLRLRRSRWLRMPE